MNLKRTKKYTNRVLQFGTGNFLRGFVDWQLDILNETKSTDFGIVMIKSTTSEKSALSKQDYIYTTVFTDGIITEKRVINSINLEVSLHDEFDKYLELAKNPDFRFVVSNTTESGIVFDETDSLNQSNQKTMQKTFPANLTRFLMQRYALGLKNQLVFIPCELIDDNGVKLKDAILKYCHHWKLDDGFVSYVNSHIFCDTLVDRIISGFSPDVQTSLEKEFGYKDEALLCGELFHFFAIKGPASLIDEMHLKGSNLNIIVTDDITPYKKRKVGILNGSHTLLTPISLLLGHKTVMEAIENPAVSKFVQTALHSSVIPYLPLPKSELETFASEVIKRFKNPSIKHYLKNIALNSVSKFKARILPRLILAINDNKNPKELLFALASLIVLYKDLHRFEIREDEDVAKFFVDAWENPKTVASCVLKEVKFWDMDLTTLKGVQNSVQAYLDLIENKGMKDALNSVINEA